MQAGAGTGENEHTRYHDIVHRQGKTKRRSNRSIDRTRVIISPRTAWILIQGSSSRSPSLRSKYPLPSKKYRISSSTSKDTDHSMILCSLIGNETINCLPCKCSVLNKSSLSARSEISLEFTMSWYEYPCSCEGSINKG